MRQVVVLRKGLLLSMPRVCDTGGFPGLSGRSHLKRQLPTPLQSHYCVPALSLLSFVGCWVCGDLWRPGRNYPEPSLRVSCRSSAQFTHPSTSSGGQSTGRWETLNLPGLYLLSSLCTGVCTCGTVLWGQNLGPVTVSGTEFVVEYVNGIIFQS